MLTGKKVFLSSLFFWLLIFGSIFIPRYGFANPLPHHFVNADPEVAGINEITGLKLVDGWCQVETNLVSLEEVRRGGLENYLDGSAWVIVPWVKEPQGFEEFQASNPCPSLTTITMTEGVLVSF